MKKIMLMTLITTVVCGLSVYAETPQNTGKEIIMKTYTDLDKTDIVKKITDRFTQLIAAINKNDVAAWEKFYSKDEFASSVAGAVFFAQRNDWIQAITSNFAMRESQHLELRDVQVVPLGADTALLTSQEQVDMKLKSGETAQYKHVFTMIWKNSSEDWQIIHSHESWVDEQGK